MCSFYKKICFGSWFLPGSPRWSVLSFPYAIIEYDYNFIGGISYDGKHCRDEGDSISSLKTEKTQRKNNPTEMIPMVAAVAILQLNLSAMKMNIARLDLSVLYICCAYPVFILESIDHRCDFSDSSPLCL